MNRLFINQNTILMLLFMVPMLVFFYPFAVTYFPGQEDIPMISQVDLYSVSEWFTRGYRDWFDTQPGMEAGYMYEVRPLTHFYVYCIRELLGDNYAAYPLAFVSAFLFLGYQILALLGHMSFSVKEKVFVILPFAVLNPALSQDVFTDLTFIQVILGVSFMVMIIRYALQSRYLPLVFLLILSALLKESTILYGVMVFAILTIRKEPILKAVWPAILFYSAYIGIRLDFSDESLNSALGVSQSDALGNDDLLYIFKDLILSSGAIIWGQNSLSSGRYFAYFGMMGVVFLVPLAIFFFRTKSHLVKSFIALFFIHLCLLSYFSTELRWAWEFSVCGLILLVLINRDLDHNLKHLVFACSLPWMISGGLNSVSIIHNGYNSILRYDAISLYSPYLSMMSSADQMGIKRIFVVNDPSNVNAKYLRHFSGTSIELTRLTETHISRIINPIESHVEISGNTLSFSITDHKKNLLMDFEPFHTIGYSVLKDSPVLEDVTYEVHKDADYFSISGITSFNENTDAVAYYDLQDSSYTLYWVDSGQLYRQVFTKNKQSIYLSHKIVNTTCFEIWNIGFAKNGKAGSMLYSLMDFNSEANNLPLIWSDSEKKCHLSFDRTKLFSMNLNEIYLFNEEMTIIDVIKIKDNTNVLYDEDR